MANKNIKKKGSTRGKTATKTKKLTPVAIVKIVAASLTVLLIGAFILSCLTGGFTDFTFGKGVDAPVIDNPGSDNPGSDVPDVPSTITPGDDEPLPIENMQPFMITPVESANISLVAALSDSAETEEEKSNTIRLIAKVSPEGVGTQSMKWTAKFQNPNSEWATGKNVEDYISIKKFSLLTDRMDVQCLAPFGEKIVITATLTNHPEFYAESVADYAVRHSYRYLATKGGFMDTANTVPSNRVTFATDAGVGTIDDTVRTLELHVSSKFVYRFYLYLYQAEQGIANRKQRTLSAPIRECFAEGISTMSEYYGNDAVSHFNEILLSGTKSNGETGTAYISFGKLLFQVDSKTSTGLTLFVGSGVDTPVGKDMLDDELGFYQLLGLTDDLCDQLTNNDRNILNSAIEDAFAQCELESNMPFTFVGKISSAYYEGETVTTQQCEKAFEFQLHIDDVTVDNPSIIF